MADIAMLVAEESEKRLKRGASGGADQASLGTGNFDAVTKVWGYLAQSVAAAAASVKADVVEPKTPFALAAFDGFFSA